MNVLVKYLEIASFLSSRMKTEIANCAVPDSGGIRGLETLCVWMSSVEREEPPEGFSRQTVT